MLRKITKDVGRYEAGNTHDFPRNVWNKIAVDLRADPKNKEVFKGVKNGDTEETLKCFSEAIDINASLQSAMRGPVKQRQRAGSPPRPATR